MRKHKPFEPYHMNATIDDLAGNNGIGRYILLPGSDGRAKQIAQFFSNLTVKQHSRGHHLYTGTMDCDGTAVDMAVISSGIGCPSMEIILHELFYLGGKRFLRVGTAGSLQAQTVKLGSLVNAQASVRDEQTTLHYAPLSVPAVASIEVVLAVMQAAQKLGFSDLLHTGTVHCKSAFYAREFGAGPQAAENNAYLDLLTECGVLASEMESSALMIQSQLYNHQLMQEGQGPVHRVLWGAILGILAIPPDDFISPEGEKETTQNLIQLAFETIKVLVKSEGSTHVQSASQNMRSA